VGHTTAVGVFPDGDSLQGVSDLAGNAWEWCRNQYDDPRQTAEGGTRFRVVRGGAWDGNQGVARADYRGGNYPDGRDVDLGFRVVCSSPIR
jgi:formylglycine-generating enzyme required for sulfatase activity